VLGGVLAMKFPHTPSLRDGVGPSSVVLPLGPWPTVLDFLVERFPGVPRAHWKQRMESGAVSSDLGDTLASDAPYSAGLRVYYFRALPREPKIPFDEVLLYRDEHLLVVDKPHFLPVMPSGKYLQETVLVRLKNKLGLNDLVPIHRIDRDTAGLVLFSVNPATRDAYHALFRTHRVAKTYQAIARWKPELPWPIRRESRIIESAHFMQQCEAHGAPNALTHITPLETLGGLARYQLEPITGQRHQLRVHMAALGLPLLGDGIYPALTPEGSADYARPLQLLAKSIALTDPVSGQALRFESQRSLRTLAALAEESGL
jgi:tRNA pseudouridine32 synthase / 23S rRNA pseudouridine746 synthase